MAGLGQPAASPIPATAGRGEGLSRPLAKTTWQDHVPSPTQASSLSTCCSSCSLLLMDNGASNSFSSVSAPSITWVFVTAPARGSRKTYFLYLQRRGGGQEVRRSGICSRPVVWTTFPTSSGPPLVCIPRPPRPYQAKPTGQEPPGSRGADFCGTKSGAPGPPLSQATPPAPPSPALTGSPWC